MSRRKLKHFAELKTWTHVFEPSLKQCLGSTPFYDWLGGLSMNSDAGPFVQRPLLVELACGYGVYALGLARAHPEAVVVGVDMKGSRLWHGAKRAIEEGLLNLRFLRARIEALDLFFPPQGINELWITFPDPHPTKGNAKRRLTSGRFLDLYIKLLKPDGLLHLKTDDRPLFEYSLQTASAHGFVLDEQIDDVYGALPDGHHLKMLQTHYEQKHLRKGKTIYYARWRVAGSVA